MISLYDDAEDKQIEMNEQFAISQNVSILAPRRSVNIYLVHQNMFLFFYGQETKCGRSLIQLPYTENRMKKSSLTKYKKRKGKAKKKSKYKRII